MSHWLTHIVPVDSSTVRVTAANLVLGTLLEEGPQPDRQWWDSTGEQALSCLPLLFKLLYPTSYCIFPYCPLKWGQYRFALKPSPALYRHLVSKVLVSFISVSIQWFARFPSSHTLFPHSRRSGPGFLTATQLSVLIAENKKYFSLSQLFTWEVKVSAQATFCLLPSLASVSLFSTHLWHLVTEAYSRWCGTSDWLHHHEAVQMLPPILNRLLWGFLRWRPWKILPIKSSQRTEFTQSVREREKKLS